MPLAQRQPLGAAPASLCVPPPKPPLLTLRLRLWAALGHWWLEAEPWGGRRQWSLAFDRLHCRPSLSAALLGASAPACGPLLSQTRLRVTKKTLESGNCDHC